MNDWVLTLEKPTPSPLNLGKSLLFKTLRERKKIIYKKNKDVSNKKKISN